MAAQLLPQAFPHNISSHCLSIVFSTATGSFCPRIVPQLQPRCAEPAPCPGMLDGCSSDYLIHSMKLPQVSCSFQPHCFSSRLRQLPTWDWTLFQFSLASSSPVLHCPVFSLVPHPTEFCMNSYTFSSIGTSYLFWSEKSSWTRNCSSMGWLRSRRPNANFSIEKRNINYSKCSCLRILKSDVGLPFHRSHRVGQGLAAAAAYARCRNFSRAACLCVRWRIS